MTITVCVESLFQRLLPQPPMTGVHVASSSKCLIELLSLVMNRDTSLLWMLRTPSWSVVHTEVSKSVNETPCWQRPYVCGERSLILCGHV